MTPKERVLTALHHEEPDKVPLEVFLSPETVKVLGAEKGIEDGDALCCALGHDMLTRFTGIVEGFLPTAPDGSPWPERYVDRWGLTFQKVCYGKGTYSEIVERPLADERAFDTWQMPDPNDPADMIPLQKLIDRHGREYAIIGGGGFPTIFEPAWYLRGLEVFLQDMYVNKDFAHALLDRVMEYALISGKKMVEMGIDIYLAGDDFGMQDRLLISPALWREFIKPRYAKLFQELRNVRKDIILALHSDGNMEEVIPDLIEVGLDLLQPIQPKAMEPARLKRKYGDKLSLWGAVDVQEVMPFGTPQDVEREVRERIRTLAPGGGYILCTSHCVQADMPLENVRAFYAAAERYRAYPVAQ